MRASRTIIRKRAKKPSRPRIGIFLEENLFICAKEAGKRFEFKSVMALAHSLGRVVHASVHLSYDAYQPASPATQAMWFALRRCGFVVDARPRGTTASGRQKSRVDVDMAFAVARATYAKRLDLVIVGTGDGDFANLVRELGSSGVAAVVLCPGKGYTSPDLLLGAATYFELGELENFDGAH